MARSAHFDALILELREMNERYGSLIRNQSKLEEQNSALISEVSHKKEEVSDLKKEVQLKEEEIGRLKKKIVRLKRLCSATARRILSKKITGSKDEIMVVVCRENDKLKRENSIYNEIIQSLLSKLEFDREVLNSVVEVADDAGDVALKVMLEGIVDASTVGNYAKRR